MTQDLTNIITPTGKGIQDFNIPQELINSDFELFDLIMGSESMKDSERQYWFDLWKTMLNPHKEKLRDILTREKTKIKEIRKKYGKEDEDPRTKALQAKQKAAKINSQKVRIEQKEKEQQNAEKSEEEALLAELETL